MVHAAHDAGIYVHFPFCLRKCPYCDFASSAATADQIPHDRYAQAVATEALLRSDALGPGSRVTSVYLGGGTPSLWEADAIAAALGAICGTFGIARSAAEITVECNPSSLDAARAKRMVGAGATRLSVGVQSTRDRELEFLGRLHDARGGMRAVDAALGSGATRVSADLIYGLPGQTPQQAVEEAEALAGTGVGHISAYLLSIEQGTPFWEARRAGRLATIQEGDASQAYLAVSDTLVSLGFEHYEVSSFARPGQRSVHNLAVWQGGPYVGLGAGAVGFVEEGAGRFARYRNVASPQNYLAGMAGASASSWERGAGIAHEVEPIDAETRMRERVMLGLRVREGVDFSELERELGVVAWTRGRRRAAQELARRGRVRIEGDRVRIPRHGWLWESDTVSRLL